MKESNEDSSDSSDNSVTSEEGDFKTLMINNKNDSGKQNNNINNINNNNNSINNNDDIRKKYKSIISFSVISEMDDKYKEEEEENIDDNNNIQDLRASDVPNNNISIWEAIKQKISNFKNQIVFNYNLFKGLKNLKLNAPGLPKEIHIFDEIYSKQDEELINKLKNIPWFSYRKDFDQIKEKETIYTSDAGWGCMLRVSQMILAQGLYKLYSMKNLEQFITEYISYFYDNKIPVKLLNKSKDNKNDIIINNKKDDVFNNNNKDKEDDETFDDFLIIDVAKECRISFVDLSMEMIKGLENMSDRNNNKKYITSPFSLRNYIKTEKKIAKNGKKAGQWFSNYDVIKIITEIGRQMNENNDCDFKVINFDDTIYIEDIINMAFEEEEKKRESDGFEIISNSYFEKSELLFNEENINNDLKSDIYIFNKRRYLLKNKFIVFVSIRHGLYDLDQDLYEDTLKLFDIRTNIGFIGGKNSWAFYFIGKCDQNLLFLDPHYVQPTLPLNKFGTNSIHESYRPVDIYYMPINDLSSSFSVGFAIKDMKSFKLFMEDMNSEEYFINQKKKKSILSKSKPYLFMVKNWHFPYKEGDDSNQDISKHVNVIENYFH
jgi:hypothetical protein